MSIGIRMSSTMADRYRPREMVLVEWLWNIIREGMDVCGGELQDLLHDLGYLQGIRVEEPCDPEVCQCAEYVDFPTTCYRLQPDVLKSWVPVVWSLEKERHEDHG